MICISSITYCIKIDWDFYQLLITFYDERATSSGGFFVQNSFPLPLREVCVSIKLSFQYKREGKKELFFVFMKWNARWNRYLSMRRQSSYLCSIIKMFFRIVSKRNFERKIRLYITIWIWKRCPSKQKLKIVKNRVKQRHFYWFSWRYTVAGAM